MLFSLSSLLAQTSDTLLVTKGTKGQFSRKNDYKQCGKGELNQQKIMKQPCGSLFWYDTVQLLYGSSTSMLPATFNQQLKVSKRGGDFSEDSLETKPELKQRWILDSHLLHLFLSYSDYMVRRAYCAGKEIGSPWVRIMYFTVHYFINYLFGTCFFFLGLKFLFLLLLFHFFACYMASTAACFTLQWIHWKM